MATQADLQALGLDPTFISALIADAGADAPLIMAAIADLSAKGFGVAWLVDCFNTLGSAAWKFFQDLSSFLGLVPPAVLAAAHAGIVKKCLSHPSLKATAKAGATPFLDWLKANFASIMAFISLIIPFLKPAPLPVP